MKKVLLIILIALVVIVSTALILLPGMARRYAINNSNELVGRQIDMEKLSVNYFTGKINITGFIMYEENEKDAFVTFDTLLINLKPFQFFVDDFVLEQFYLKGLKVNIIQQDSIFNFDDLVSFYMPEEDTTQVVKDTTDNEPFQYHLSNLELKDANFIFDDRNINKVTNIEDLSFFIPYIGWNQEEKSEAGLRFNFKREGYFDSNINVDPVDGDFDAEITINKLYLDYFREYAAEYANIDSINGVFNSTIRIYGNTNDPENSVLSGQMEIIDFEMTDLNRKKFLAADKIECTIAEMKKAGYHVVIDSLIFTKPYVYFEMDSITNNFFEIFNYSYREPDSAELAEIPMDTSVTEYEEELYYAVNNTVIVNGIVDYRDNLTGESFDYHLSEIMLDTDSLESTSEWINLYSTMLLNERGKLTAEVGLNPLNPYDIDLEYVITDFQLSDLNIYSKYYMGFPILYGDMYYKSSTQILNNQLSSENQLIIEHAELGEKRGGLYDLPVKFALFLLKDREGVINLDIPVRGDLDDPTVSVGKIVWNTLKNFIIKVAASPFDFLAGLIGVDPKDIQKIEYDYGDTTLNAQRQKQLDLLLELEQKKEGLQIELIYFNDREKEKEALAVKHVGELFNRKNNDDYTINEEAFRKYVFSNVENDSLDIPEACLQIANVTGFDSLIVRFEQTRKLQVYNYLHSINDSTLIEMSASKIEAPKNVGAKPLFEVKYSTFDGEGEKEPD